MLHGRTGTVCGCIRPHRAIHAALERRIADCASGRRGSKSGWRRSRSGNRHRASIASDIRHPYQPAEIRFPMSSSQMTAEVETKLERVRSMLSRELAGAHQACLTCSFQAEDVLLTRLALDYDRDLPILFLDTGYHFAETYAYRDRIAHEWQLNLINLLPEKTVAEQEYEAWAALSIGARPVLQTAEGRTALQGSGRLPRLAHGPSARTGKEPRRA